MRIFINKKNIVIKGVVKMYNLLYHTLAKYCIFITYVNQDMKDP